MKKKEIKKIKQECWNLDFELIKWLNEHLKVYNEDNNVDTSYEKFTYKGKEMTFQEVLDRLIEVTDILLSNEPYGNAQDGISAKEIKYINARKNEMYDLLKLAHWAFWW